MGASQITRRGAFTIPTLPPLPVIGSEFARYDASQLGVADGAALSTVAELFTGTNPMLQATSGRRPTFQASAFSGRGGILFDGVDDYLSCLATAPGKTLTCFAVLQYTGAYSAPGAAVDTISWHYMIRRTSSTQVSGYVSASDHNATTTPQAAHLYTLRTFSSSGGPTYGADYRVDSGSLINGFAAAAQTVPTGLVLGTQFESGVAAGNYAPVLVGEVLWYVNNDLTNLPNVSDANATLIRAYLKAKWGTP